MYFAHRLFSFTSKYREEVVGRYNRSGIMKKIHKTKPKKKYDINFFPWLIFMFTEIYMTDDMKSGWTWIITLLLLGLSQDRVEPGPSGI